MLVWMVACFAANSVVTQAILVVAMVALIACARIPLLQVIRSIAPLAFIIVLTVLFNLFFTPDGSVIADWGFAKITQTGLERSGFVGVRLTLLLIGGSLLTLTTTTLDITEASERLLAPLARIGVPAHEFALVLGIALRFLPQFADELRIIRTAQLSRGAKLATSPLRSGFSSFSSLIVPLFASAFRHADTLSAAMDARCYHGAQGRTRLHPLAFARRDAIAAICLACLLVVVFAISLK